MHKANPQKKEVICEVGKLRFWDPLLLPFMYFLSSVMPSANLGMQQAFPLHLNFSLEKGYDEAFHTEKMQD